MKQFLACLLDNQLYVKRERCKIRVQKNSILRNIIWTQGALMYKDKMSAITKWPNHTSWVLFKQTPPRQPVTTQAFIKVKRAIDSALILTTSQIHPNFSLWKLMPQRFWEKIKFHSVGFYSRKMTPSVHNSDVGNQELLAVKLALEEWRHWLKKVLHPFGT